MQSRICEREKERFTMAGKYSHEANGMKKNNGEEI